MNEFGQVINWEILENEPGYVLTEDSNCFKDRCNYRIIFQINKLYI